MTAALLTATVLAALVLVVGAAAARVPAMIPAPVRVERLRRR